MNNYVGSCDNCYKLFGYGSGCPLCGGPLELVKQKTKQDLNKDQLKAIKLIEGSLNEGKPFGSFIFKSQTYPGDLDVIEIVEACCTVDDVVNKMNTHFKSIIKKINSTRGYYVSEIKVGIDERYKIIPLKMDDADFDEIKIKIKILYKNELLTSDEKNELVSLLSNMNKDNFDKLKEFFRKKYTVRWTPKEVLTGYKYLPGDKKYTFKDALKSNSMVKIDAFMPINGRYIEVTNFFVLVLKQGEKSKILNFKYDYENQIREEIKKFNSKTFYKPFKMAKRMWGLARYTQNFSDLEKLMPLFQSGVAIINQVLSEIETMILMYTDLKTIPSKTMDRQIDNFKYRLSGVYEFNFDNEMIDSLINDVLFSPSREDKIILLEKLQKILKEIVNTETIAYLTKVGLYPVPGYYLPGHKTVLEYDGEQYPIGEGLSNLFLSGYQTVANQYRKRYCDGKARPLYKGELHPGCQNFTGPGTRIDIPEVANYKPYNNIDACSKVHDFEYNNIKNIDGADNKKRAVRFSDEKVIDCYDKYPREQAHDSAKFFIKNKINLENFSPSLAKSILKEEYVGGRLTASI